MILATLLQRAAAASLAASEDRAPLPAQAQATSLQMPQPQPQPQLYGEEQLFLPRIAEPRTGDMSSLVDELMSAPDAGHRRLLMQGALEAIGFEWLAYGTVASLGGRWWPTSFFTAYANPEWTARYFAQRHYEVDLRQTEVPASGLPLAWDVEQIEDATCALAEAEPDAVQRREQFVADLRASGIRSGLILRLASPMLVNQQTVISLHSSEPGRRWISDEVVGQALTLGLSLHEYLSRHSRMPVDPGGERIEVSATQQYILQHLLQGRSDKEIASRLDLSAHAVDYHMRQLRRRFAARNRVQLVNAVQQGASDFGVLGDL